jgi:hypothetical protein
LLLGILIVGEGGAECAGRYLRGKKRSNRIVDFPAATPLMDLVMGAVILCNAFEDMPYVMVAAGLLVLTHLDRVIRCVRSAKDGRIVHLPVCVVHFIEIVALCILSIIVWRSNPSF